MEEPGEDGWNEHLPDIGHLHTIENSEPNVHWEQQKWSREVTSTVPDPVNEEFGDTTPAVHVKVLANAIWVELFTSIIIVVPEEGEVGVTKSTKESLR